MKNSYFPTTDAQLGVWLNNFNLKLAVHATTLGITATELASVQKDNAAYQFIINMMESHRQYVSNLTGYKNMLKHAVEQQHLGALPTMPSLGTPPAAVPEGIFDRVSKMVTRIKHSLGYSENIGSDLGIISPAKQEIDIHAMQPEITVRTEVGKPHLRWKKGHSEAIDLFVDHNDGNGFTFIGRLLKNEYIDHTAIDPSRIFDEWKYKAIYVVDDKQVGLYSKITSVDVKRL